jgi:hypothetical protein
VQVQVQLDFEMQKLDSEELAVVLRAELAVW